MDLNSIIENSVLDKIEDIKNCCQNCRHICSVKISNEIYEECKLEVCQFEADYIKVSENIKKDIEMHLSRSVEESIQNFINTKLTDENRRYLPVNISFSVDIVTNN